ncbi:MAG: transcriptional activator RfaH [Sphingomonadaceae bacterium]|nr:transcriptional activator RfaH [Sphingomonadaceae bacterium]
MPEDTCWYLVQTKPGHHDIAQANLQRQGVETFAPLKAVTIRRFGRMQRVVAPAFPGYLFVRFDPEQVRWRALNNTLGVSKIVSFEANRPAAVPAGLVEQIRLRCDDAGFLKPIDDLRPGDRVKILDGPFAALLASVEEARGGETVRLLLSMMGQRIAVTLPREAVARSDET